MKWKTSKRTLTMGRCPLVMGILNVTPDSFSDGGRFVSVESQQDEQLRVESAVAAGLQMQANGADIIDIGGESTRPYSEPVEIQTELERVVPVIERLASQLSIPISIDSSKAVVAHAAMEAGAEIINDITGLEGDPEMGSVAQRTGAGVCVMHMQGTPQTMQDAPHYTDVVEEIEGYLIARRDACLAMGLELSSICLDPGIGFGKTHEHNLELLRATARFKQIGCPLLIGHSRKGFIKKQLVPGSVTLESYDPMAGTLGVSLAVAVAGAHVIRVHDVAETCQALRMFEAAGALDA